MRLCSGQMSEIPTFSWVLKLDEPQHLVVLPGFVATVRKPNDIGTTCSSAPLSTTRNGCYYLSNIDLLDGLLPTWVGSPSPPQNHFSRVFLIWRSQRFPGQLLTSLRGSSATSFQQILLEAATRVIEELIFLPGFASFLRPIPDSQIHLCPFLCNAEIAPSHVFLPRKSQVSAGASATRRGGRKAILINNCQFYCRLLQTRMSGSIGERHSGWNVYFLWHNSLNFNDLCVFAMSYAAGTQSEPSSTTTLEVFGHGRLTV